jgi:predicted  nucleic acid-binding Zn-ribbon protein
MTIHEERREDANQLRGEIEYLQNRLAMLKMERADYNRLQDQTLSEIQGVELRLEALEIDLDDITTQMALEPEDMEVEE